MPSASPSRRRTFEFAICGIYIVLVGWQLFGPVPIGLPDNGDFAKVFSAMAIGPAPGNDKALHERYFTPDYAIGDRYRWVANMPSSEYWIAKVAKRLALWFLPNGRFDVRLMGLLHMLVMTGAVWLFLRAFWHRPRGDVVLASALLLLICTDIEYVQFFSTPYADAASIVFFSCLIATSLTICLNPESVHWRWILAFSVFGCLFLSSKLQHQLLVLPLCAIAALFAWRSKGVSLRVLWAIPVIAFLATTYEMAANTRPDYRADPVYAMIFSRLARMSPYPDQVLLEFGLPPDTYRQYVGTLPFQKGYILNDPAQREYFVRQVTLGRVAGYYLSHPDVAVRVLTSDLKLVAPDVNLEGWGVKRFRVPDYAAHKNDMAFKWWSSTRRSVAAHAWFLTPVLYLAAFLLLAACAFSRRLAARFPSWPVLGLLAAVGVATFVVASLNDYVETSRHIIIFQVATDFLIFLFAMDLVRPLFDKIRNHRAAVSAREQVIIRHI